MKTFFKTRILLMKDGNEKKLMVLLLKQVKKTRGLTSFITRHENINGKWLIVSKPYDFPCARLLKAIIAKANYQGREEFEKDVKEFVDFIFDNFVKK